MLATGCFSSEYIKMCEKNYLLFFPKMHKGKLMLSEGDYYCCNSKVMLSKTKQLLDPGTGIDWLPTLDELIDIIGCSHTLNLVRLVSNYLAEKNKYIKYIDAGDSKAVLLAIYMHSKYKKMWHGSGWIDIEL